MLHYIPHPSANLTTKNIFHRLKEKSDGIVCISISLAGKVQQQKGEEKTINLK
jgi:hypothetical protein